MKQLELVALFLESIPAEYPKHMLCYFAANLVHGNHLSFTSDFLHALGNVEAVTPGYAAEMLRRIGSIEGVGEEQYEAVLQVLAEIYVTSGLIHRADREKSKVFFTHEPSVRGHKNPEFEVRINGNWLVVEVKAPRLIQHRLRRTANHFQLNARLPRTFLPKVDKTLPRDNPVKDFLVSAEEKFTAYERFRSNAYRVLVIIWDDYCNEPITALLSPGSGLLTENSFFRDENGDPVIFYHIDGVVIVRHQHQLIRATRCESLVDDLKGAFIYEHNGFPPKAFIECSGGRKLPNDILQALNATPLQELFGTEYSSAELVMWVK